ncbi:MAG: outer membrane protein assembly factor BamB family protein [Thermoplasmatota archaeon]
MTRRRGAGFRGYAARHWRVPALTVIVMTGTFLFLTISDHGHEPLWSASLPEVADATMSPDASITFVLEGNDARVHAISARDDAGRFLWSHALNATQPVGLAAGEGWVAALTPKIPAHLYAWEARTGHPLASAFIEGTPGPLAGDGSLLALTTTVQGNDSVRAYDAFNASPPIPVPPLAQSLDVRANRIAVGTQGGRVLVYEGGRELFNATVPYKIQSVRLSADGRRLFVGGGSLREGDFSGGVAFLDLGAAGAPRAQWTFDTLFRVGLVELSADGERALAVIESPPAYQLVAFDTRAPTPLWTAVADGTVSHPDTGTRGGASLSPDGALAVLAAREDGPIRALDAKTGAEKWRFDAHGATVVAFPSRVADEFAANARAVAGEPYREAMVFSATREPFVHDLALITPTMLGVELAVGVVVLGVGYQRDRR